MTDDVAPTPDPAPPVEPGDTAAPAEAAAPAEPAPAAEAPIVQAPLSHQTGRYKGRFVVMYVCLGAIVVAAAAGFVVLLTNSGTGVPKSWSPWRPASGSTAQMTSEIADHVSHEYHLNKKGTQLVAVVSEPPEVTSGTHKITISNIALRNASAKNKGIEIVNSAGTWVDQLCGLSPSCSIAAGQPSVARGRLVRREALEVALYTFKFVPAINAVVAFMPPPPGATANTLLYLQRSDLKKQLSEPLAKTLPLATPPLPSTPDPREAATIDKLTLPATYNYSLQQLQDASALLVLNPFKT